MSIHSIHEARSERAKVCLASPNEAKLLVAKQMFLCAAQLSQITLWLAANQSTLPCDETGVMQTCVDAITHSAERVNAAGEYEMRHQPFGTDPRFPS